MKSIRERGVTYYIIDSDYAGNNKDVYKEFINLETLFVNDITVMYDWGSGLYLSEDSETGNAQSTSPLTALSLTKILLDDAVIEWMHRSEDELYE